MPSVAITMSAATMTAIAEKPGAKIKIKSITVDNALAGANAVLQVQDVFTPSISVAVAVPVLTTTTRFRLTVAVGVCQTSDPGSLDGMEFLGLVQLVRGVLDANCFITIVYDFV